MRQSKRPIFIVGAPRSGTTLFRLIIDSHPNIACGPETHFLRALESIVGPHWDGFKLYQPDKEYWYDKIAEFFESFKIEYSLQKGKSRWADKTPPYIQCMSFIDRVFPDCQFIHVIRDGRDVVASHRERWGLRVAYRAIDVWRNSIQTAKQFFATIPADRFHELKYEDLVRDSESVMREVFEFLDEPWDARVMEYDQFQHDIPGPFLEHSESQRKKGDQALIYQSREKSKKLGLVLALASHLKNRKLLRQLGYE